MATQGLSEIGHSSQHKPPLSAAEGGVRPGRSPQEACDFPSPCWVSWSDFSSHLLEASLEVQRTKGGNKQWAVSRVT